MKTLATHNKPFIAAKMKREIAENGAGVLCDKCKAEMVYTGLTVCCEPPQKGVMLDSILAALSDAGSRLWKHLTRTS